MKKISLLMTFLTLMLLLVSCGEGISTDEAKATGEQFILCIAEERYEDAAALTHPRAEITAEKLSDYIAQAESQTGADFSSGFEITKYTDFYTSISTGGASFELSGIATCGERTFTFELQFIRDSEAYGISYFNLTQQITTD